MPQIQWPISDLDQTVTRPVVVDMIQEMKKFTDIPDEVPLFYPGPSGKTFQPGSSLEKDGKTNQVRGSFYNQLSIEVDEQYEHDSFLTTPVEHPEHLFVFRDDYLNLYIKPAYSAIDVTINLKFRARDKTTAERWRDQLKMKIGRGHLVNLHDVTYSYFIPPAMLAILQEIHRLRENVAGYGEDWSTYFEKTVTGKFSIVTDQAGKNQAYTISETQMRVQGFWDFDGAPEKGGHEDGGETWTIAAAYKFRYHRPEVCYMKYPLMVHNQLLDQKWRPTGTNYEVEKQERVYQWSTGAFRHFEKNYELDKIAKYEGVFVPDFDEWMPDQVWPFTRRLISIMLQINTANPTYLAKLPDDMDPYTMEPEVLAFMYKEAPYLMTPRNSIFNVALYQGTTLLPTTSATVDAQLNVISTFQPDLRQDYHVRLSVFYDINQLTPDAKRRLQENCGAAIKIFDWIDPTLKLRRKLPACIMPGNWLPKPDLQQVTDDINKGVISKGNQQVYGVMKTFATASIIAHRGK
jgi:hypothetical protein